MTRPRRPLVTLVDAALPPARFQRLARAVRAVGAERLRATYQTTFWFPLDEAPGNLVEEAVLRLARRWPKAMLRATDGRARLIGVEWWLSRMYTSRVAVDFHVDRDNARFEATGRTVSPRFSSVLFLTRATGGLLAVTREPVNPRNPAQAPDRYDFDFVEPVPNRFVVFRGSLTHGVLDARNEVPGRRLPRERSLRVAVAINWWSRRPLEVPRFGETAWYRALAPGRPGGL